MSSTLDPRTTAHEKQAAVVFYARDFLATEFPQMGRTLSRYSRLYIVVSAGEQRNVSSGDPEGVIFNLSSYEPEQSIPETAADASYNNDRYLRAYSATQIAAIVRPVLAMTQHILRNYDVKFYLDEPVSGFPNLYFNRAFTSVGATCLHFQTSWIPGYMFFSRDAAHEKIVPLDLVRDGPSRVTKHVEQRLKGSGVPLYVLNYTTIRARLRDIVLTLGKWLYRKVARRKHYYLDSDASAHLFHVRSLLGSFRGGYLRHSELDKLTGKYVLYPLHYEPESLLNYFSEFSRQEEIAEQILDALPLGYELILKEHPSQPGALNLPKWRDVVRNKRVIKVPGKLNSKFLLQYDVAVVSIGSTLAIEAALAGRPVGVLGKVHFASMPGVTALASPREIDRVLRQAPATQTDIERWYGEFLNTHCFVGNIMKGRTTDVDLPGILARLSSRQDERKCAG